MIEKHNPNPHKSHGELKHYMIFFGLRCLVVSCILASAAIFIISTSKQERIRLRNLGSSTLRSLGSSRLCPSGREFIKEYRIAPSGSKFSEISYMAHSSQKYQGHDVVWCVDFLNVSVLLLFDFRCVTQISAHHTQDGKRQETGRNSCSFSTYRSLDQDVSTVCFSYW